jgi:hypothetical protein
VLGGCFEDVETLLGRAEREWTKGTKAPDPEPYKVMSSFTLGLDLLCSICP